MRCPLLRPYMGAGGEALPVDLVVCACILQALSAPTRELTSGKCKLDQRMSP